MELAERRYRSLDFLLDYSKGTLWWVNNRIWEKVIPKFVRKKNGNAHPGLSIARKKADSLHDVVPMLIGTSKIPWSDTATLAVWEISPPGTEHHDLPTYFSPLRPCFVQFDEFGRADGVKANSFKRRLDEIEMKQLDEILDGKGG